MSVRVVILEDDYYARESIATHLQRDAAIRVVGEFATAESLIAALGEVRAAVCWLDLDFPQVSQLGVETAQRLHSLYPQLKLLASALEARPEYGALLGSVLDGLVLKHECAHSLSLAISAVMRGMKVITPHVQERLTLSTCAGYWVLRPIPLPHDLPPHLQRAAYLRYVRQLTPDQIAEELTLSLSTVESYLKIVKGALHLDGRDHLLTRGFMTVTRGYNP